MYTELYVEFSEYGNVNMLKMMMSHKVCRWRLRELDARRPGGIVSKVTRRVLACPVKTVRLGSTETENQGGNRLTQTYLENGN